MKSIKKISALTAAMIFALTSVTTAAFAEDILITITVDEPVPPCFGMDYPPTFSTNYLGDPLAITPGSTAMTQIGVSSMPGTDENCGSVDATGYSITHSGWTDFSTNPVTGLTTKVGCAMDPTVEIGAGASCGFNIFGVTVDVDTDVALASAAYYDTITITLVP
jgi:hypothetical protein